MRMFLSVNQDTLLKRNLLRKLNCGQCPSAQLGLSLGTRPCLWFEWPLCLQMQTKQMRRRMQTTQTTVELRTALTWKRYVNSSLLEVNFNLKIPILESKLMYSNSEKKNEALKTLVKQRRTQGSRASGLCGHQACTRCTVLLKSKETSEY